MGFEDPFSTTYQGSFKAGQSLGEGIQSAAGSVADVMKQKQAQVQQAKQRQQGFQMLKDLGLVKQNQPTNDDLAKGLTDYGQQAGVSVNVNHGDNPDQERKNMMGIYKAMGIPMPKGSLDVMPGTSIDMGGGMSYTAPKPVDPEIKEMKEMNMQMSQERLKDQEQKTTEGEWDKLDKITNPNIATNRSPLGMAGRANMSADRAITTLNQPDITNQEAGNVMADVASIYQNGSPTEFGMSEQGYKTVQGQVAAIQQYLTGKPTDALTPAIKDRLKGVLQGMKNTNTKVIKQNLNYIEKAHGDLIKKDPDKWSDMKSSLLQDLSDDNSGSSNSATSTLKAAGINKSSVKPQDFSKMSDDQLKALING